MCLDFRELHKKIFVEPKWEKFLREYKAELIKAIGLKEGLDWKILVTPYMDEDRIYFVDEKGVMHKVILTNGG